MWQNPGDGNDTGDNANKSCREFSPRGFFGEIKLRRHAKWPLDDLGVVVLGSMHDARALDNDIRRRDAAAGSRKSVTSCLLSSRRANMNFNDGGAHYTSAFGQLQSSTCCKTTSSCEPRADVNPLALAGGC
jgi:hypothetical protein